METQKRDPLEEQKRKSDLGFYEAHANVFEVTQTLLSPPLLLPSPRVSSPVRLLVWCLCILTHRCGEASETMKDVEVAAQPQRLRCSMTQQASLVQQRAVLGAWQERVKRKKAKAQQQQLCALLLLLLLRDVLLLQDAFSLETHGSFLLAEQQESTRTSSSNSAAARGRTPPEAAGGRGVLLQQQTLLPPLLLLEQNERNAARNLRQLKEKTANPRRLRVTQRRDAVSCVMSYAFSPRERG